MEQDKGRNTEENIKKRTTRRDPRELINAIVWVARTGSPWCELPEEYGPHTTAYNNFRKWTDDGTIGQIFAKVSPKSEETTEIQLEGTYVKAHQHSAGVKKLPIHRKTGAKPSETDGRIARSREGQTSKIHGITDGQGRPMKLLITAGTVNDSTKAIELLKNIIRKGIRVLADRGYDAAKILAYIQYCCAIACIPPSDTRTIAKLFMNNVLIYNDIRFHEYIGYKSSIDCKKELYSLKTFLTCALAQGLNGV
jgi:transposase